MTFVIVRTIGFTQLDPDLQAKIMSHALKCLKDFYPPTDMIVYYPKNKVCPHFEDENRTFITFMDGLTQKVYVKLDDYGEPSEWNELYGEQVAKELNESGIKARHIITFMLADEY